MKKETYYNLRKNYDELKEIIENEPDKSIAVIYESVLQYLKQNYELIGDFLIVQEKSERHLKDK